MFSWLSSLTSLLALLAPIVNLFTGWQARREARKVVTAEIAKEEAEATVEAATIVAENREPSDAIDRLDRGTF